LLAVVIGISVVAALAMLLNDIVRIAYLLNDGYTLEASVGSPNGIPAGLPADSAQSSSQFWTVLISTSEAVPTAPLLQVIAVALTSLTFLLAAAVVTLLCARLWTGRTFSRSTAGGMLALGVLAVIVSVLAPWLQHRADAIALDHLGYSDQAGDRWALVPQFDLGSIDAALMTLGVVLVLAALVYLGAQRLQRDTDGLV
jgi:hypothetical protein